MRDHTEAPWGYHEVLYEAPNYKVKRLVVYPGERTSLQSHQKRAEHMFVVQGEATIAHNTECYRSVFKRCRRQSIDIFHRTRHRIENKGKQNLIIIEIQTSINEKEIGTCLEEDITRYEDDYGRANTVHEAKHNGA